jgi:hypothetical protein
MNGIFLTNDEYAFPDTRMEVELQVGDVIKPIYPVLYSPDNYDGYYEGNPIVVDENGLTMDLVWLSPGWYQYGFKFIDVYGNGHYSKLVDIEITDQA